MNVSSWQHSTLSPHLVSPLTLLLDKSRIVEEGNYHKFTKGKESPWMAKKLLETGDRELVEVSTHDTDLLLTKLTSIPRPPQQIASGAWDSAQQTLWKTEANGARIG